MAYIKMKDIDDFTYFRNRISFQMRALGIHSTKALSEKLRETGFFKRTDSMGNIHLLKASSIDKIIQKHFQHNIPNELPDSLTANHVQAYANVLNCSTDFILGNTHTISKDIHIQDLCNRTGLTEASILNLLKMTDTQFAFRTLRVSANESRKILNSLLTMPEFPSFIRSLSSISYEFQDKQISSLKKLENEIGTARLKTALDWDKILDPIYTGAEPSKLELQDVFLLREAMEKDYESQSKMVQNRQLAKYQVIKDFTIFPSAYRVLYCARRPHQHTVGTSSITSAISISRLDPGNKRFMKSVRSP